MMKTYFTRATACMILTLGGVCVTYAQEAKVGDTEYSTLKAAVDAAPAGSTVTVLSDVTDTENNYYINKNLTINLNGQTVKLKLLFAYNGANVVLEDLTATQEPVVDDDYNVTYTSGSLELTSYLCALQGGSLTINSGKYTTSSSNSLLKAQGDNTGASEIKSTVTVNGGYLESKEVTVFPMGKGAVANVNGGVLVAKANAVVSGNGTYTATQKYGGTTINITGGTMIGEMTAEEMAKGYVACGVYHPQEGVLNISGGKIVAVNGCGVLMRGGTLNQTGGEVVATGDASLSGKVGDARVVVGTSGVIFDRDANFYDASNTSVTISGDSKVSGTKAAVELLNTSNKEDADDAVNIKGGTFSGSAESLAQFLDESDYTEDSDGSVTVTGNYYQAKVGNNKYKSLYDAITEADKGSTVTVLCDLTDTEHKYWVSKDLTFDLNGKTVNLNFFTACNGANLVLEDLTATTEPVVDDDYNVTYTAGTLHVATNLYVEQGSSMTINSGKYVNDSSSLLCATGDETGATEVKSTVTVNGGYLESQEFTVSAQGKGAVANVKGGVLVARDNAVVAGNGTNDATTKLGGTTINISGGTMIGKNLSASKGFVACGVYHPQEGELNISGGKIVALGGCGVLMRGGTLNQTGGEVVAIGDASLTGMVGDARVVVGTCGVIFDRDANYYDASNTTVTISGDAKVLGSKAAVELLNTKNYTDTEESVKISGGTFSSDVTDYCVDGYVATANGDGTYGLVTGDIIIGYDNSSEVVSADKKSLEFKTDGLERLVVNANVDDATVKMTKTFSSTNWSSLYVPFDITVTEDMLTKFAFAKLWDTELVHDAVTLEFKVVAAGETIDANTPCLIKALTAGENTLEVTGTSIKKEGTTVFDCSTLYQKYTFYGVYEKTTLLDKYGYFLNASQQQFSAVSKASTYIRPTTFYMTIQNKSDNSYDYPSASQPVAKSISFHVSGDEATGIHEVNNGAENQAQKVYNLQGVYMGNDQTKLPAGLYIVNGKKVVVK